MEELEKPSDSSCILCSRTESEAHLIDMESNSLKCGDDIIEFADLLLNVLHLKINYGLICEDCQNQLTQFYYFKANAQISMKNEEWNQRTEIVRKLDQFLDEFDFTEELAVMRYNQCFAVVPDSKRRLMQDFQNWQPRVLMEKEDGSDEQIAQTVSVDDEIKEEGQIEIDEIAAEEEAESIYDEFSIIVEEHQDYSDEMTVNDELELVDVDDEENYSIIKKMKPSKEQREWANEATKACYTLQKSEDGVIPTWSCSLCGKNYRSAQAIRLHFLSKHLQEEDDMMSVTDELKDWIRKENRERRVTIESMNGNKFEWNCGMCKFTCTASKTFRIHLIETHIKKIELSETKEPGGAQKFDEISFITDKSMQQLEEAINSTAQHLKSIKTEPLRVRKSKTANDHWTCKQCMFQFQSQRAFDAHVKLHNTLRQINPFTVLNHCGECKMFFISLDDLTTHVDGHSEGRSVLVPAEGISLQKTILYKRLTASMEVEEGRLTCGHCGKKFDDEVDCKSHLLINHTSPLICPKDGRQFAAMQPYICHLQKVHSDMFPDSLGCTHCKMSFDNIYEKLAHMKLCDEKQFSCDHCGRKFSNKNYLNSHLKRELGLLSCNCSVCGKVLKAKDELKIHMRTHTKEKPYKCSICEKRYTTTSARASHMETHKDTVIQCEVCSVKFVARRHYIVHYKRYHDEAYRQQKFNEQTCQVCGKQFLRKDRLKEHMLKVHKTL